MSGEDHYYIAGYSAEDDPYSLPNGVLDNKLGITNTQDLNELEADLAALAISNLLKLSPPKDFSVETLKSIHREIFSEIYPWAGKVRVVDIGKGDTHFESHQNIEGKLNALFADCKTKNYFAHLSEDEFAKESAEFLIELNRIHPFREGNGRTQRLLLSQIALNAGYKVAWEGISESAMRQACIDGLSGNPATMKKTLKIYLSPSPSEESKAQVLGKIAQLRGQMPVGDQNKPKP